MWYNVARIRTASGIVAIPSVVYVAAAMSGPGHIKHSGRGDLVLGDAFAGLASPEEIDAALGIKPTATLSEEGKGTATAVALAEASAIAAGGSPAPSAPVAVGNVIKGGQQFQFQCQR